MHGGMSRIEMITITNGRNKSEKEMFKFLGEEFSSIKNLLFFIVNYIYNPKYCMKRFEKLHDWSMSGLSALIEAFL
jgi:hypothetical protein